MTDAAGPVDDDSPANDDPPADADPPADDGGPLAYQRGDRIGVCLDVDGTVYRSGSIFVEALAFLPYADGVALSRTDRRHRRNALAAVADYHGDFAAGTKWRTVLTGVDALRVAGADGLSERLLATLARRADGSSGRTERSPSGPPDSNRSPRADSDPNSDSDAGVYRSMSRTILEEYGALVRGKRRNVVADAMAEVVAARCPVDPRLRGTLDRLARRDDADLYLVTDAPEHVATAYARKLSDDLRVVGTSYEVRSGRYTGAFDRVDKGRTVSRLRADRGWAFVVAAGDSPVDAAMARDANLFLAVAGQSDSPRPFPGLDAVSLPDSADELRERLTPGRNAIRVPRETEFERALRTALGAVGIDLEREGGRSGKNHK